MSDDAAEPTPPVVLDEWDQVVYAEAFRMAGAVHRFLARYSTHRVIDAGLLDEDVVRDLVASNDRMYLARVDRVTVARKKAAGE